MRTFNECKHKVYEHLNSVNCDGDALVSLQHSLGTCLGGLGTCNLYLQVRTIPSSPFLLSLFAYLN
jgi:hypothetical protein